MPVVAEKDGRIASLKLEYNLTEHCNYGCAECSHLSPYMMRRESGLDVFTRDVAALAEVMRVHRLRFVGGEPLLNKRFLDHIRIARESGIAKEIQACTNGALLDRTPDEALEALDTLTISWYPDPRVDQALIDRSVARCERLGTRVGVLKIDEFRRMQVVRPLADAALVKDVFSTCEIAHKWYCQTFYEGRFYLCSRPLFTASYLAKVGTDAPDFREIDGVPLHAPGLKKRLLTMLRRKEPLASCRYCLGTVGENRPWRQLDPAERKAPARPNTLPEEAIDRARLRKLKANPFPPLRSFLLWAPPSLTKPAATLFSRSLGRD